LPIKPPPIVGAKATLKPRNAMKKKPEQDIIIFFIKALLEPLPSSPLSSIPTEMVIRKTRTPHIKTQRLLKRFSVGREDISKSSVS
jgi:hypothetical protein